MLRARSRKSRASSRGRVRTRECACGVIVHFKYAANRAGSDTGCRVCSSKYTIYDRDRGIGSLPANLVTKYGAAESS